LWTTRDATEREVVTTGVVNIEVLAQAVIPEGYTSNGWWNDEGEGVAISKSPYLAVAGEAATSPLAFSTFKKSPRYRNVLEHIDSSLGAAYLVSVLKNDPRLFGSQDLLDRFRLNDAQGGAEVFEYGHFLEADSVQVVDNDWVGLFSPSTLRYVHCLSLLRKQFPTQFPDETLYGGQVDVKSDILLDALKISHSRVKICEVGGGYGGLAHVVLSAYPEGVDYTIFDLPAPAQLANRYLKSLGWSPSQARATTLSEESGTESHHSCDLIVSHYALTELDNATQHRYIEHLLTTSPTTDNTGSSSGRPTTGAIMVGVKGSLRVGTTFERAGFDVKAEPESPHSGGVFEMTMSVFRRGLATFK